MSEHEDLGQGPSGNESPPRAGFDLPEELKSFEAHLAALAPRTDRLDRERLAFLAGRASAGAPLGVNFETKTSWRRHAAWPAAFAGMSAVAAALLAVVLLGLEKPSVVEVSPSVRTPLEIVGNTPSAPQAELVLRTHDVRVADIDARLDRLAANRSHLDSAAVLPAVQDVPMLTPKAWQQVIQDGRPTKSSSRGSSGFLPLSRDTQS